MILNKNTKKTKQIIKKLIIKSLTKDLDKWYLKSWGCSSSWGIEYISPKYESKGYSVTFTIDKYTLINISIFVLIRGDCFENYNFYFMPLSKTFMLLQKMKLHLYLNRNNSTNIEIENAVNKFQ